MAQPATPSWWLAGERRLAELPSHTVVRLGLADGRTVELLTPRALVSPEWLAQVAALVLDPPPPPPGAQA